MKYCNKKLDDVWLKINARTFKCRTGTLISKTGKNSGAFVLDIN